MFAEKTIRLHDEPVDAAKIADAQTALICARMHLRGGKRRLQEGYSAAGFAALYDAVLFGMRYYIVRHAHYASLSENTDLWDAASLFHTLACAGVFDDPLAFNRFSLLVERALWTDASSSDAALVEAENMLNRLGVTPFEEAALPTRSLDTY